MTTVPNQARKLLITAMKSDITYRMMMISARQQLSVSKQQSINQEKNFIKNNQLQRLYASGVENVTLDQVNEIVASTSNYDTELTLIEIQDEHYESEMKMLETKLAQLNAEEQELDKTISNGIKKEFGVFAQQ